jgi:hypothetical protein
VAGEQTLWQALALERWVVPLLLLLLLLVLLLLPCWWHCLVQQQTLKTNRLIPAGGPTLQHPTMEGTGMHCTGEQAKCGCRPAVTAAVQLLCGCSSY